ncbi:alpha/beta fold hydrolase [Roseospirillum parvum]|uniref:Haloacetate dehalogenase n=1 Tax=Roseospirillum parvum TaxID=83401 RepID=A0A1G8CW27_9PROT|nr:alpha/beta hydrolase [Roseospirillum parvum]SDH49737.1 haloacetate dehalogenase [Roseospirillum parvum]
MTIFEQADARLLPGFRRHLIEIDGRPVRALTGGDGPPLLMLHGDPQTHLCWHRLAPALAERFSVVLTDLRGRGESHKPGSVAGGTAYAKRDMAAEQLAVMRALGHATFALVGHDRGARVARRLALDHPAAVSRLAVMDIVPALDFYDRLDAGIAHDYFYFSFLPQPRPLPERLIAGDPRAFMESILHGLSDTPVPYDALALEAYLAASTTDQAITAMCECFRAGYQVDRAHDAADRAAGRRITCPTLVMWGETGCVGRHFDVPGIWRAWCDDATFAPLSAGHFIPEEAPQAALAALGDFLGPPG